MYDLFPDRLAPSELGEIPEGWEVSKLAAHAEFQNGYAFKSKDWSTIGVPIVKIGSVKSGLVDLTNCSYVPPNIVAKLERFRLNPGDLLVGMTGYPGETGLVPFYKKAPFLNQRVGRISAPVTRPENHAWIWALLRDPSFKRFAEEHSHGSAQANVSGVSLMEYPVVYPGQSVNHAYSRIARIMIGRYLANARLSATLAAQRDALLPGLVGGELEIIG